MFVALIESENSFEFTTTAVSAFLNSFSLIFLAVSNLFFASILSVFALFCDLTSASFFSVLFWFLLDITLLFSSSFTCILVVVSVLLELSNIALTFVSDLLFSLSANETFAPKDNDTAKVITRSGFLKLFMYPPNILQWANFNCSLFL